MFEDGNGIATAVRIGTDVSVGNIDVRDGESTRGSWDKDFGSTPFCICRTIRRDDGDARDNGSSSVGSGGDALDTQGGI